MAGELRTRNFALLAKIEATEGVDAAPVAADAILVEEVTSGAGTSFIESTEATGSIDAGAPAVIGAPTSWTIRMRLRGVSGTPSAGNVPPADPILQGMGFERVFQAAIAAEALASGTATTATLGAAFAATAQAYRGMPLVLGGGAPAGRTPIILDYTAAKVATLSESFSPALGAAQTGSIPANILYRPRSSGIPSLTLYHYRDGLLRKLFGARGTGTISMDTAGIPILSATFTGSFGGETDAALPTGMAPLGIQPPLFVQGTKPSPAFVLDRGPVGLSSFSLDVGNGLTSPADPNTVLGFSGGVLISRDTRLSIDPQAQLVATRDVIASLLAGTQFSLHAIAGASAGNRLAISAPAAQIIEAPDGDREGIMTRQIQLKLNGQDAATFLSFF